MTLEASLPTDLQGPTTTITRIAAGLSGAGVYRVDAAGQLFVLKIAAEGESLDEFRRKAQILKAAAAAGLAPRVVHVDEARRSIVSAFIVDRSFPARFANPQLREAALMQLGQTLRRVHEVPLPPGAIVHDARALIAKLWPSFASFAVPAFVAEAVRRMLPEEPPECERVVLSHNDVNPSNLVDDGEHLLLLDWDTAGANDPFYDLAAIAVFLRMDDATCLRLLAAHDGAPVAVLPERFVYDRRLVAVACGTIFVHLARHGGHAGATGETLESSASLVDCYQRMRAGTLNPGTAEGQWAIGLALIKASATL